MYEKNVTNKHSYYTHIKKIGHKSRTTSKFHTFFFDVLMF